MKRMTFREKIVAGIIAVELLMFVFLGLTKGDPNKVFNNYFDCIKNKEYDKMYELISDASKSSISEEEFTAKNRNIYEGIDAMNIDIKISSVKVISSNKTEITYDTSMDTSMGIIKFKNTAALVKKGINGYAMQWEPSLIFPDLEDGYKVRVKTEKARRGNILDRNDNILAGTGDVSSVGIVPGKLSENREKDIIKVAQLLKVTPEAINKALSPSWVRDDSFVPIKKIPKNSVEVKKQLLQIPGIKINTVEERVYPFKEKISLLTGYVQNITKEDLKVYGEKGYTSTSVIGKIGLEKQFEDRLRGQNGGEIYITDETGKKKKTLVSRQRRDGEDIKLTIDIDLQSRLYEELKDDKGMLVVMHPKTGELLALVSTPSYDANDFVLGMTSSKWESLKNDEGKPMYSRFLQAWCPGSTFKPLTAAIGLTSGKLTEAQEFPHETLSWQKDKSWGKHRITTMTRYQGPKNLENALVYSDNICFAQAALKMGTDTFTEGLDKLMFNKDLGILNGAAKSQYSNSETIKNEHILADSGYGQGEILVNPIHMASIYSAFRNEGNMVKPYIEYKPEKSVEYLVEGAFSKEAASAVEKDLMQVIKRGTARDMRVPGVDIAGKTGTAEITNSGKERSETIGWFNCFTTDDAYENQLLIVGMVEEARENGGSHYIIEKIKSLFQ